MTGAEHYRQAELLLADCQIGPAEADNPATYPAIEITDAGGGNVQTVNACANALAAAQVHATLALVSATLATP